MLNNVHDLVCSSNKSMQTEVTLLKAPELEFEPTSFVLPLTLPLRKSLYVYYVLEFLINTIWLYPSSPQTTLWILSGPFLHIRERSLNTAYIQLVYLCHSATILLIITVHFTSLYSLNLLNYTN